MDFRTQIHIPTAEYNISHRDKIMMLGSCFTQHIGEMLSNNKFSINLNPFGVIYNPASISQSLQLLIEQKQFLKEDLFEYNGLYSSFYHHGSFSDTIPNMCLEKINYRLTRACGDIRQASVLFITFGTSYVYQLEKNKQIVSNCHKLPASHFRRYRLTTDAIIEDWDELLKLLIELNPNLKVIFTVSPIRHLRDGAHDNQLSKATLLLAIEELVKNHPQTSYFPSYEIVLDDLRDYRFYEEDMTHPNRLATKYIWERFGETYFNNDTQNIVKEWNKLHSSIHHRPLNGVTDEYKQFLKQTLLKVYAFDKKYPYICLDREIDDLMSHIENLI